MRMQVLEFFSDGAKKLSLNEKERGFPMGLRVMSEPDGAGSCILHVPSSFDSLQIRDGQPKVLTGVEVHTYTHIHAYIHTSLVPMN